MSLQAKLDAFKADTELQGDSPEVRNFPTIAPRELRLDARAPEPFAPLDAFLGSFEGRVLLAMTPDGPPDTWTIHGLD